jgi:hypothetical protein
METDMDNSELNRLYLAALIAYLIRTFLMGLLVMAILAIATGVSWAAIASATSWGSVFFSTFIWGAIGNIGVDACKVAGSIM